MMKSNFTKSIDEDIDNDGIIEFFGGKRVEENGFCEDRPKVAFSSMKKESFHAFVKRHYRNVVHFFVEDWFLSAMLGIITAVLSISMDITIEYLQHFRIFLFDIASSYSNRVSMLLWVLHITSFTAASGLFCLFVSKQAIGSGIPEVKVIMHGFPMRNYLTLRTMIAKMVGLTLALGGGLPVGKEGPFVHMGAIVATLLTKVTSACQYQAFFSNEGRQMELLSSGCAVGIACTFSAPAGAVLYGIESTSKYFAVKNYWRSFFATTCSALIFRFANAAIIPQEIAGTITAYYQTKFPNEVFLVEELPIFALIGVLSGLFGAFFVLIHRRIEYCRRTNRIFRRIFGKNPLIFTIVMAVFIGAATFPNGLGKYFAGKLTFGQTLADFISNCSLSQLNHSDRGCPPEMIERWTGESQSPLSPLLSLSLYFVFYYFVVAICVSLAVPAGIFVPSFVIGACGGRILGELMAILYPDGIRGPGAPQIFPGLYAVVGAAAYTGAVTHSLSIAVIVCETTGQLSPLLPVLIALMIANAISSFLQPSIYESIIIQKQYPYLVDLPPSRTSVHTLKVEQVMTHDVVCLTRQTTYKELIDILNATPNLRAYPLVSDIDSMILLGSVARKYLNFLLMRKIGGSPVLSKNNEDRKPRGASEMISSILKNSSSNLSPDVLTERHISGSALLANSPLLPSHSDTKLASFIRQQTSSSFAKEVDSITHMERLNRLREPIDLDEIVIDPAPFQLVLGTSLYKVHTLFSLLGLHHAYVTNQGKLVGVVAIRELRNALVDIYSRGAIATNLERKSTIYSVCPVRIDDENDISIAVPRRSVSVIRCDRSDPLLYDNYGESDGPQYPLNENHLNLSNASLHPSVCMVSVRNGTNKDDGESGNVSEEENARLLSEDNLKLRKESDE